MENHKARILIVDDEETVTSVVLSILSSKGHQCDVAADSTRALELFALNEYDAVITDVVMPGMNGRDLADELHTIYPNTKILFMSGYTADAIAHRGVLEEDVQFIQKPFSIKDLGVKVREVLNAQ